MNEQIHDAVTRRTFVRGATVAVGALATGCATSNRIKPAGSLIPGDAPIRIGLIGCGGRGTGAAGQALKADPGVVLYAMGDAFPDRLTSSRGHLEKQFSDRVDVPEARQFSGFDAYQKVIDSDVDMVILTTPPHFRPEHFKAAVAGGKHIFMEKPMAVDGSGVR